MTTLPHASERLLKLLQLTGNNENSIHNSNDSNSLIQSTACEQIGDICKADPSQCEIFLEKIINQLLFHEEWETRIGAGNALETIFEQIPPMIIHVNNNSFFIIDELLKFDIASVVEHGVQLKKDANDIIPCFFDTYLDLKYAHMTEEKEEELLSLLILERIGLLANEQQKEKLLKLQNKYNSQITTIEDFQENKEVNVSTNVDKFLLHLEEQQLNELKSKCNNSSSNDFNDGISNNSDFNKNKSMKVLSDEDFGILMRVRTSLHPKNDLQENRNNNKLKNSVQKNNVSFVYWFKKLIPYLLHQRWEFRHGGAIGLRVLLKCLRIPFAISTDDYSNIDRYEIFIEGYLICMCALVLDRFNDFHDDIIIAPVRETIAQVMSLFINCIPESILYMQTPSNSDHFIFEALLKGIQFNDDWNVRFSFALALKYILLMHIKRMPEKLQTLMMDANCQGLRDTNEDVVNVCAQMLITNLNCLSLPFINKYHPRMILQSLMTAFQSMDDYSSTSMINVLIALDVIFEQFPTLISSFMKFDENGFLRNIFERLMDLLLNHSSLEMKQQSIKTLRTFIEFTTNDYHIIQQSDIMQLISVVFETYVCEQYNHIQQELEIKKYCNFEERRKQSKYQRLMSDLKQIWIWICKHLLINDVHDNDSQSHLMMCGKLVMKLFQILQRNSILKRYESSKERKSEELPVFSGSKISVFATNLKQKQSENRKRTHILMNAENEEKCSMDEIQPRKRRKLMQASSNALQNNKQLKSKEESFAVSMKEITLWSMIDNGCALLSQLFTCSYFYPLVWRDVIIKYIVSAELSNMNNSGNKVNYAWKNVFVCWLYAECYSHLSDGQIDDQSMIKIVENLFSLCFAADQKNAMFCKYQEFDRHSFYIQLHTKHLIDTFSVVGNYQSSIYKQIIHHFGGSSATKYNPNARITDLTKYYGAILNKYELWNVSAVTSELKLKRTESYNGLCASYLNADFALSFYELLFKFSFTDVLTQYSVLNSSYVHSHSQTIDVLKNAFQFDQHPILQFRASKTIATLMKLLTNEGKIDECQLIWNDFLIEWSKDNANIEPKIGVRMCIQSICAVFTDELFDAMPFIITVFQESLAKINLLILAEKQQENDEDMDVDVDELLAVLQIYSCLISCTSNSIIDKYLLPLLQNYIIPGIFIYDIERESSDISDQCRYCIMQYLFINPSVIMPVIIQSIFQYSGMECKIMNYDLGCSDMMLDILSAINNFKNKKSFRVLETSNARFINAAKLNMEQNYMHIISDVLPYLSCMIVPLLQMKQTNEYLRRKIHSIFSIAVTLIIMEQMLPYPPTMNEQSKIYRLENQLLLTQLIEPGHVPSLRLEFNFDGKLRPYQAEGLNWLWFLHECNLNGILADDMGLGKTLQALLVIVASNHSFKRESVLPSLVICPQTLVWHWLHEIKQFVAEHFTSLVIDGCTQAERKIMYQNIIHHQIVIISYKDIRSDINLIVDQHWNYCILDEGHLIKNYKLKTAIAVKRIQANHRLILSGTPIQNNVLDLWSLFDFLMPGYLGDRQWFDEHFSNVITKGFQISHRNSDNDMDTAQLKLKELHEQILPFILRRLKRDVLQELPPKIIQDLEVQFNPDGIQISLYEHFSHTQQFQELSKFYHNQNENISNYKLPSAILQSLNYLRQLLIHPKLVMSNKHPLYLPLIQRMNSKHQSMECFECSAKFVALQHLLEQLLDIDDDGNPDTNDTHRVLIFVHLQSVISLIEEFVLNAQFPNVKYRVLSDNQSPAQRFEVVQEFNRDSSISVLLLTISAGGLGLNIPTADIVIFMSHSWNAVQDLQAMDRVHRIGQKKTVQVFRIIVRKTIEYEMMNERKFKEFIAKTVMQHMYNTSGNNQNIRRNEDPQLMIANNVYDLFQWRGRSISIEDERTSADVDVYGNIDQRNDQQQYLSKLFDNISSLSSIHSQQYNMQFDLNLFLQRYAVLK